MEKPDKHHGGSVLITGGSGMIGKYLTISLLARGYQVSHLSRLAGQSGMVRVFRWDPDKGILDPESLRGTDYIIHLSGTNIGKKRWTKKRREEIVNSRVKSARLIFNSVQSVGASLKAFISASGINYYGSVTTEKIFSEEDPPASDFLGTLCRQWEEAADLFSTSGVRTVKIRSPLVLEKREGGLSRLINPAKYGIILRLGDGKQYFPWIHISDLIAVYHRVMEDQNFTGAYNAVAPHHVNHDEFMRTLAKVMKRPVIMPPVPGFLVRAVLGDLSDVILKGSRITSEKIIKAGYRFVFDNLHYALNDIVNN